MDVGMSFQPPILFGFVSIKIIQHDMNFPALVVRHDAIHEIQKLTTAAPLVMTSLDLAGHDVESRKQRSRPVAFVAMAETIHGLAIWQPKKALC